MANFGDNKSHPFEPPMADPVAFLLTWTTYGTWLPGDERGWSEFHRGFQLPDPIRELEARARMSEDVCLLDDDQRRIVETTIRDHCQKRGWKLHAVNCRTNHVHVVVSSDRDPEEVRDQFKAWGTRKLKESELKRRRISLARRVDGGALQRQQGVVVSASAAKAATTSSSLGEPEPPIRLKWWTERGSQRWIDTVENLDAAVRYVVDRQ